MTLLRRFTGSVKNMLHYHVGSWKLSCMDLARTWQTDGYKVCEVMIIDQLFDHPSSSCAQKARWWIQFCAKRMFGKSRRRNVDFVLLLNCSNSRRGLRSQVVAKLHFGRDFILRQQQDSVLSIFSSTFTSSSLIKINHIIAPWHHDQCTIYNRITLQILQISANIGVDTRTRALRKIRISAVVATVVINQDHIQVTAGRG